MSEIAGSTSSQSPAENAAPKDSSRPASSLSRGTKRKRQSAEAWPNVYSAVAGHVNYRPSHRGHAQLSSRKPLAPQDVLFERYGAPDRYAEPQLDWYGAHRWLAPHATTRGSAYDAQTLQSGSYAVAWAPWEEPGAIDGRVPDVRTRRQAPELSCDAVRARRQGLPDSDLCKALHRYASAFYATLEQHEGLARAAESRPSQRGRSGARKPRPAASSFRSLDETALLCFAVLLEESMAAQVSNPEAGGMDGWRALTVGLSDRGDEVARGGAVEEQRRAASSPPRIGATIKSSSRSGSEASSGADDAESVRSRNESQPGTRPQQPPSAASNFGSELAYDPDDY